MSTVFSAGGLIDDTKEIKSSQIKFEVGFFRRWEKAENSEKKSSRSKVGNQQTQVTYDVKSGDRAHTTSVGSECSHRQVKCTLDCVKDSYVNKNKQ